MVVVFDGFGVLPLFFPDVATIDIGHRIARNEFYDLVVVSDSFVVFAFLTPYETTATERIGEFRIDPNCLVEIAQSLFKFAFFRPQSWPRAWNAAAQVDQREWPR